jgi:hypothetical protein
MAHVRLIDLSFHRHFIRKAHAGRLDASVLLSETRSIGEWRLCNSIEAKTWRRAVTILRSSYDACHV